MARTDGIKKKPLSGLLIALLWVLLAYRESNSVFVIPVRNDDEVNDGADSEPVHCKEFEQTTSCFADIKAVDAADADEPKTAQDHSCRFAFWAFCWTFHIITPLMLSPLYQKSKRWRLKSSIA